MLAGLLASQCRGAWVPAALMLGLWAWRGRHFKTLVALAALAAATVTFVVTTLPHTKLAYKLQQTTGSGRWEGGSQSAAWEMIQTHVLRGHGFGDAIYHAAYAAQLPTHPHWVFRSAGIGPENSLLQLWFACGVFGLLALVGLYGALFMQSHISLRKNHRAVSDVAFAVFLVFAGCLLLRGLVESVYLNYFGLVVGLSTVFYRRAEDPS
jgi:O-antigen ligase